MNAAVNTPKKQAVNNLEPVLCRVLREAEEEHRQLQQMFELMGWGDLPDMLKMEIKEDVSAMVDELKGHYSSCDPHVGRRRQRVVHWVNSYSDGICSLDTAVQALRVRSL
ncbi:hypothetical protein [Fodinibius sediminis]|uniref:Uncharacterized protein n=1 Tax=Fodinibius sediminis TaxID=1214077 RepID=A0A521BU95_9BACT|nr:hypothetical protein [Fodinibius sediminis]SMO50726.1 hypothetical protein SAMN06265218_10450 [Fodinibius sediminis]